MNGELRVIYRYEKTLPGITSTSCERKGRLSHGVEFRPLSPDVMVSCDRRQIPPFQPHGETTHALWYLKGILWLDGNRMEITFHCHVHLSWNMLLKLFPHRVSTGGKKAAVADATLPPVEGAVR